MSSRPRADRERGGAMDGWLATDRIVELRKRVAAERQAVKPNGDGNMPAFQCGQIVAYDWVLDLLDSVVGLAMRGEEPRPIAEAAPPHDQLMTIEEAVTFLDSSERVVETALRVGDLRSLRRRDVIAFKEWIRQRRSDRL